MSVVPAMNGEMIGVREYSEGMPVYLSEDTGRPVMRAFNEAGHNCTEVDLVDLLIWIQAERHDLLALSQYSAPLEVMPSP